MSNWNDAELAFELDGGGYEFEDGYSHPDFSEPVFKGAGCWYNPDWDYLGLQDLEVVKHHRFDLLFVLDIPEPDPDPPQTVVALGHDGKPVCTYTLVAQGRISASSECFVCAWEPEDGPIEVQDDMSGECERCGGELDEHRGGGNTVEFSGDYAIYLQKWLDDSP